MEFYNTDNEDFRKIAKHEIINPMVKIELLDSHENAYAELIEDISAEQIGTISESYKQGVRKTTSFTIFDPNGDFIPDPNNKNFWINRKFKIYVGLAKTRYYSEENPLIYSYDEEDLIAYLKYNNPNNWNDIDKPIENSPNDRIIITGHGEFEINSEEDIYWFSKGVYVITDINASHNLADKTVTINGVDKFGMFGSETGYNEMIGTFSIPKGFTIYEAIFTILNQDMGNGQVLDPIEPIVDPYYKNVTIPFDIDKGPGSYISESLTDLATTFRADIYYDDDGRLNFWRSLLGEENANLPIIWDFYDTSPEYINSSLTYNLVRTANRVCVVGDNPNGAIPPTAISENRNAASPIAIQKIGIKSKYLESSTIQTATEAKDFADYMLKSLSIEQNTISFECTLIPSLTVNRLFTLTDTFYKIIKESFLIQSLTCPIGIGTMSLSGSNIKELPTY